MTCRTLVIASALLLELMPAALTAQERWVAVGLTPGHWPVPSLVVLLGPDSVMELPIPNPSQGDPRWRVTNGRLETWDHRTGDTTSRTFVISRDVLTLEGRPGGRRVAHGPAGTPPITGVWVAAPSNFPLVYYHTYRSDGHLIQDISGRDGWWKGDSLFMVGPGVRRSFAFRKSADTLYVTGSDGRMQRFVRKPWGCYGTDESDRGVVECQ